MAAQKRANRERDSSLYEVFLATRATLGENLITTSRRKGLKCPKKARVVWGFWGVQLQEA